MKKGLLLIDRGSREREAKDELEYICKKVKEKGNYDYSSYCFLEVVPPYIEEGITKSISSGIDFLTIVPYFLYPGRKIKAAVSNAIKFQSKTDVKLVVSRSMSMHKSLIELIDNKITTTLKENDIKLPKNEIDVLIIGHGSKDPNAQLSIRYITEGLDKSYRNVKYCFLEIETPNISQGVSECEKNNPKILVVVLYFLHEGAHVKRDIFEDLNPALVKSSLKRVLITKHIGTDEKIIDLILERAKEVENAN